MSGANRCLTSRAGLPATTPYAGTSFVTTALHATTAPVWIVTPESMTAPLASHTSCSMITSPFDLG